MPEAERCPHCGAPMATNPGEVGADPVGPTPIGPPAAIDLGSDIDLPATPLLAPGSHDDDISGSDLLGGLGLPEPDPNLGAFVTPPSGASGVGLASELLSRSSSGQFPAIDLGVAPPASVGPSAVANSPGGGPEEAWSEEVVIEHRSPWPTLILASYASAVTLGLAWTLWKDKAREKTEAGAAASTVAAPESARQSGLSRKVVPPEPILGEHFADLGQPLRVGDLEITPVEVRRRDVMLQRADAFSTPGRREGGKGALVLRLKLTNRSKDAVFAPLDRAYVRERGKDVVDTFLTTAGDERVYPYPLAVDSEWSIVGQDFGELKPGQSKVVDIASAPDAPPDQAGPFTWRVRLRTGINRTDAIGVRWPERPAPKAVGSNG